MTKSSLWSEDRKAGRRQVYAHTVIAAGVWSRSCHRTCLRIDTGNTEAFCQESRCGPVPGTCAQAGRFRRHPAAIGHQQGWRQDAAQAAGGKRALYPAEVVSRILCKRLSSVGVLMV